MTISADRLTTQFVVEDPPLSAPGSRGWLGEAERLSSVDAMRAYLAERYPALHRDRLKRLAIVGAGPEGQRLAGLCGLHNIKVEAIADDNPNLAGTTVTGVGVTPVAALRGLAKDTPIIIASHRPLLLPRRLADLGFETVAVFLVLQVLDPAAYRPHMFYDGWFEDLSANIEQYKRLAGSFADSASVNHLDAVLGYRLTGDTRALHGVIDWNVYAPADLFRYGDDEVFVDAGAYDGDSIKVFIEQVGGSFSRAIGLEPDPKTFARLKANFAHDGRVEPIAKGLHSATGMMKFVADSSRGAGLHQEGDIEVQVAKLDDVLKGDRVTMIKMNIEGAELDALDGARQSIERWGPRLAISAYHQPDHLWRVPFLMQELRPPYRIAMRQHDLGVIETVAYAY